MIGIFDITNNFKKIFLESYTVLDSIENLPKLDGLYIDWVDRSDRENFAKQAFFLEYYTKKKVPTVVYDRYMKVKHKEYKWLDKFNTYFFEPALNNRLGFKYLPYWTELLSMDNFDLLELKDERSVDLAYNGIITDKMMYFEGYYKSFSKFYPNRKVVYCDGDIPKKKVEEFKECNLKSVNNIDWKDVRHTLLIDSYKNYNIGYLDPYVFDVMKHGCVPMIPIQHRYFLGMFQNVKDYNDMAWFVDAETDISEALIEDIYINIELYYPEFMVQYAQDSIKECF